MLFIWIYDPSVIFLTNSSPAVIWHLPKPTTSLHSSVLEAILSLSAAFTLGAYQPVLIPELSFQNKALPTVQTMHA